MMVAKAKSSSAVEAEILAFLSAELPKHEVGKTPIADWYRNQYLKRELAFSPYDTVMLPLLERTRSRFDRVTEIGAGIGQNCIQFALAGWNTVAVECGEPAFGWMENLLTRLGRIDSALASRVRPMKCLYPDNASGYLDRRTLAFMPGLLCPTDPSIEQRMLDGLGLSGGAILDPRLFFRRRDSPEEQAELIASIERLGFKPAQLLWDANIERGFFPYRFLYFERGDS